MATRKELIRAVGQRYREATRRERRQILNEFVRLDRLSPQACDSNPGDPSQAIWWTSVQAALRRGGAGGTDRGVGGVRSDLRQAAEGAAADADRGDGAPRPSSARHPRSSASCWRSARQPSTGCCWRARSKRAGRRRRSRRRLGDPAKRPGAHVLRLERSAAGVFRGRPGRALRRRRRAAGASFTRSCSPTSPPAGRNACRCWCASRPWSSAALDQGARPSARSRCSASTPTTTACS